MYCVGVNLSLDCSMNVTVCCICRELFLIIPLCVPQAKEGEEGEGAEEKPPVTPVGAPKGKKPANQFNYSERASQTYNNPLRVSVGEQ